MLKVRALVALPTIRDPSLNFFVDAAEKEPRRAAVDTRGWLSEGPGRRADTFPRFFLHFLYFLLGEAHGRSARVVEAASHIVVV